MIVISVTNCPMNLRGDLTKWLIEINSGVYVGKVNAKVRDELWKRVCENIKHGQATMVYSTNNEQGYDFKVHNTVWEIVDYEGINLVKIPSKKNKRSSNETTLKSGFSRASKFSKMKRYQQKTLVSKYVIIDIETTGLNVDIAEIIEIGALKIYDYEVIDEFQCLIKTSQKIDKSIEKLTGITDEMLQNKGIELSIAIKKLFDFIDDNTVIGYNVKFDMDFLTRASIQLGEDYHIKKSKDVLNLIKKKVDGIKDYKLSTVAEYLSVDTDGKHRALRDCNILFEVINELNKI